MLMSWSRGSLKINGWKMLEDELSFWHGLFSAGPMFSFWEVKNHGFRCLEILSVLPSVPVFCTCLVEELLILIGG